MGTIKKLIHGLTVVIFALLVIVVALQVLGRLAGIPIPWTEEAARFLFVWLTFLAGYITIRKGMNVCFDMVIDYLPEKAWRIVFTLVNVISVIFLGMIIIFSVQMTLMNMTQLSSVMGIPMGLVYLAMPIGSLGMIIAQVETYLEQIKERQMQETQVKEKKGMEERSEVIC